jgi:hypothetical protein
MPVTVYYHELFIFGSFLVDPASSPDFPGTSQIFTAYSVTGVSLSDSTPFELDPYLLYPAAAGTPGSLPHGSFRREPQLS